MAPKPRYQTMLAAAAVVGGVAAMTLGAGCFGALHVWHEEPMVVAGPPELGHPLDAEVAVGGEVARGDVGHVSVFYDPLASYGAWEQDAELGWIWSPSDDGYVPYRQGTWVDTEAGPTWVADEPYGWAVTHYGRWFYRDRWYWLPGTTWAPAWVAWRVGDGHVGWAAAAPEGFARPLPASAWSFVAAHELYTSHAALRGEPSYNGWMLHRTRPWVRWATYRGERRYVVGPRIELAGRPLAPRARLGALPPERLRWIPRWHRLEQAGPRAWSIRAGPASPQRLSRHGPVTAPSKVRPAPRKYAPHRAERPAPEPRPRPRVQRWR